jgi:hypothetical protein
MTQGWVFTFYQHFRFKHFLWTSKSALCFTCVWCVWLRRYRVLRMVTESFGNEIFLVITGDVYQLPSVTHLRCIDKKQKKELPYENTLYSAFRFLSQLTSLFIPPATYKVQQHLRYTTSERNHCVTLAAIMTRQKNRNGNSTTKTRPLCKNVPQKRTSTCSGKVMTRKRKWNIDTTLREDRIDQPVVAPTTYYDDADDIRDHELIRYCPDPPQWDESPRTSMHILDLSTTSKLLDDNSCNTRSISPPKLPAMGLPQRKVRFATPYENKVHFVDYTSTASKTWYNRTEYAKFKSDLKDTIIALYRSRGQLTTLDSNQYTFLGLERSLTHQQITGRKKLYSMYVQMIVQQQEYCWNDPMQLRDLSMMYSHSSVRRAQIRGMMDHDTLVL